MATAKRKYTLNGARFQKTQILFFYLPLFSTMFFGLREGLDDVRIGNLLEKIISKESNVVTWVAVTSSPQFSRTLCTEIGLAGAP